MKKLSAFVFLLCLICHPIFAQEASLAKAKDARMRKIDRVVENIEKDSSLICFITNKELTLAKNVASIPPEKVLEHQLDRIIQPQSFVQSTPTLFYLKDSVIIKIIYQNKIYYFLDNELILSDFECQDPTDLLIQCKPAYSRNYNYYWRGKYHKSLILNIRSGNCSGCALSYLFLSPLQTQQEAAWLLKRVKEIR